MMQQGPDHGAMTLQKRARAARPRADRALTGRISRPVQDLRELTDYLDHLGAGAGDWDRYGEGGPVAELENRVANLVGKPAAVMFPSGVMAQQAMLRVWCDQLGCSRVALPDLSHLLHHELDGPRLLHGLRFEVLGEGRELPTADNLREIPGRLGALLLELPLRDAGYLLPTWPQLIEITDAARARGAAIHFDGARLWESQPWFDQPLETICAIADSVYVSLYKGLGGMAGALVAGPQDAVAEARDWRTRHGGTLFSILPYAVAGLRGLDRELPRMGEYHERAVKLAAALRQAGFAVVPDPPHAVAFRLMAPGTAEDLYERVVAHMEHERVALTPPWSPAEVPGWGWTEITVDAATMDWSVEEATSTLARVLLGNLDQ
jgi:threonine aldolase